MENGSGEDTVKTNTAKIFEGVLAAVVCLGCAAPARAFWTDGGEGGGALGQLGLTPEAAMEEGAVPSANEPAGAAGLTLPEEQNDQTPLDPANRLMAAALGADWEARLIKLQRDAWRDGSRAFESKELFLARLAVEQVVARSPRPAEDAARIIFAMDNFARQQGRGLWGRSEQELALRFLIEPALDVKGALDEMKTMKYQCVRIVNTYLRNYLGLQQKAIFSFEIPGFDSSVAAKEMLPPTRELRQVVDFLNNSEDTMMFVIDERSEEALMKQPLEERLRQIDKIAAQLKGAVAGQFGLHYLTFIIH